MQKPLELDEQGVKFVRDARDEFWGQGPKEGTGTPSESPTASNKPVIQCLVEQAYLRRCCPWPLARIQPVLLGTSSDEESVSRGKDQVPW